jgi:hypothetical protein
MKTIWILIAALLLTTAAAASTDPFVGKWILNVQRSKFPPGACPKSMVIEMETAEKGIRYHSETTYANGSATQANYRAQYNGQQSVVMGVHGMLLPVSLKRIDSHTVVASYSRLLQLVATSRRTVSVDGNTMTIRTVSRDQAGKRAITIGVYQRQHDEAPTSLMAKKISGGVR